MVYLINKETKETIQEFNNVINWGFNFVEYTNGGRCKIYCDHEKEYFTDKLEEENKEQGE